MVELLQLIRRRAVLTTFIVFTVFLVIGTAFHGLQFATEPIPLPQPVANVWALCNGFLSGIAMLTTYRNLWAFEKHWTWQEIAFSRGIVLILMGSAIGYATRSLLSLATITIGTPLVTTGLLVLISATLRAPERFEEEPDGSPR